MAKKQTRRSISVSRTTYERLKAFCESNNISMSQFVETRVGDFLGVASDGRRSSSRRQPRPAAPTPVATSPASGPGQSDDPGAHRRPPGAADAGADDLRRRALRRRAAAAGDQAEGRSSRAQAGREAAGPDLHVLIRSPAGRQCTRESSRLAAGRALPAPTAPGFRVRPTAEPVVFRLARSRLVSGSTATSGSRRRTPRADEPLVGDAEEPGRACGNPVRADRGQVAEAGTAGPARAIAGRIG